MSFSFGMPVFFWSGEDFLSCIKRYSVMRGGGNPALQGSSAAEPETFGREHKKHRSKE